MWAQDCQIGKEEIQLHLFADGIIFCTANAKATIHTYADTNMHTETTEGVSSARLRDIQS